MARDTIFQPLIEGFKSCFNDIWTLEINTSVVSEIGGYRFNPYSIYSNIISIPHDIEDFRQRLPLQDYAKLLNPGLSSEKNDLRESIRLHLKKDSKLPSYLVKVFGRKMLQDDSNEPGHELAPNDDGDPLADLESTMASYVLIRERLRRSYESFCRKKPQDSPQQAIMSTSSNTAERIDSDATNSGTAIDPFPTLETAMNVGLLEDSSFLRELRSLRELYYLVGGKDASDSTNINDLISAQTIIQIDGDVMNRFHKALLNETEKDFLIKTHQAALSTGQGNWHSLVNLIIESVNTLVKIISR